MKIDTTRDFGSGRCRRVVVLVITLVGAMLAPSPAQAEIRSSDFPSKIAVKSELDGRGQWFSFATGSARALGAKPPRCRSDLQMQAPPRTAWCATPVPSADCPTRYGAKLKMA